MKALSVWSVFRLVSIFRFGFISECAVEAPILIVVSYLVRYLLSIYILVAFCNVCVIVPFVLCHCSGFGGRLVP